MKNDDYKTEFEEHKKAITVTDESNEEPVQSRVELHSKSRKPKQRSRHKFINIFLGLFVLVPIVVLVIVFSNWMSPKETLEAEVDQEGIQFETNDDLPEVEEVVDSATKKEQEKIAAEKEQKEQEQREQEALAKKQEQEELKRKQEQEKIAHEEAYKREQEELKRKEQQRLAQEEAARKAAAEAKAKEEASKAPEPTGKTHTVKPGETLYRISVNYYGHGEGVNKIKQANGLSSNSISTGQSLIIP